MNFLVAPKPTLWTLGKWAYCPVALDATDDTVKCKNQLLFLLLWMEKDALYIAPGRQSPVSQPPSNPCKLLLTKTTECKTVHWLVVPQLQRCSIDWLMCCIIPPNHSAVSFERMLSLCSHNTFQQWMSWLPQWWRTQRIVIRNANCDTLWIIQISNAHCAPGIPGSMPVGVSENLTWFPDVAKWHCGTVIGRCSALLSWPCWNGSIFSCKLPCWISMSVQNDGMVHLCGVWPVQLSWWPGWVMRLEVVDCLFTTHSGFVSTKINHWIVPPVGVMLQFNTITCGVVKPAVLYAILQFWVSSKQNAVVPLVHMFLFWSPIR